MSRLTAMERALRVERAKDRAAAKRTVTAAESAARFHAARGPGAKSVVPPVYATDGIVIPRRKHRVLLDLAPVSVEAMRTALRRDIGACKAIGNQPDVTMVAMERVLTDALGKTR